MFGRDISTGQIQVDNHYSTQGPPSTWCRNVVPSAVENTCFVYRAKDSCTDEQLSALADGTAVVEDFVVVNPRGLKVATIAIANGTWEWCK